jgi:hypothetical protein
MNRLNVCSWCGFAGCVLMKTIPLALGVFLFLPMPSARAASPKEEAKFLAAAKAAFAKHDANALVALTCWDRVPDKLKDKGKKRYAEEVAITVTGITLTNPDAEFPDLEWKDKDGVAHRSNRPVIKQLKVSFKPDGSRGQFKSQGGDVVYPVGEKGGKLYLLEPAPVK